MPVQSFSKQQELTTAINWSSVPAIKPTLALGAEIFSDRMAAKTGLSKKELMFRCIVGAGHFLNFWGNNFSYGDARGRSLLDFAVEIAKVWAVAWEKQQVCKEVWLKDAAGKEKRCTIHHYEFSWGNGGQTYLSHYFGGYYPLKNERWGDK